MELEKQLPLSTSSSCSCSLHLSALAPRAEPISTSETPLCIKVPAIHVLLGTSWSAPADEFMLVVVHSAPCRARVCPRIVRVGHATTNEELKRLELRSLVKCHQTCTWKGCNQYSVNSRLEDRSRALKLINEKSFVFDKKRGELNRLQEEQVSYLNSSKKEYELSEIYIFALLRRS